MFRLLLNVGTDEEVRTDIGMSEQHVVCTHICLGYIEIVHMRLSTRICYFKFNCLVIFYTVPLTHVLLRPYLMKVWIRLISANFLNQPLDVDIQIGL